MLDREAIVAATNLPALADALLGPRKGDTDNPTWPCPGGAHDQASPFEPAISVFMAKRGDQRWACSNCGADGTAVDLVMASQHLGIRDALEFLKRRLGPSHRQPEPAPFAEPDPTMAPDTRAGLDAWVDHASHLLWTPYGEPVRDWLLHQRKLPEAILRQHRVGVSSITLLGQRLATRRSVAGLRSSSPCAVLPVALKGQAIFAQFRLVDPPDGAGRYVPVPSTGDERPPLGLFRPPERRHPEILVTEGIIDALSANAAGYRAAAILAPELADAVSAVHLARLEGPLVLALDPDYAGEHATERLAQHLWAQGRRPALLAELGQDLNDAMCVSNDWSRQLTAHVRSAVAHGPVDRVPEL